MSGSSARPVVHVAAAIMRRADEVVLVLQGASGETPFWALPGGVVDDGELVPEALAREVLEETGLEVAPPTRLAFVRQLDNRRPVQLVETRGPGPGYLATVWVFDVDEWRGERASASLRPASRFSGVMSDATTSAPARAARIATFPLPAATSRTR